MITIYWHCLSMTEADETFVNGALDELAEHLKGEPIKLTVTIKALTDEPELEKKVDERLNRLSDQSYTFSKCDADIGDLFLKFDLITETCTAKLLVYCSSDSRIALAAKSEAARMKKPPPCWGATCGSFSAAYPPKDQLISKFTIWHEALHLLGIDDCYDENTLRRNCKCETCVMQYKPPKGVDENWPSPLCDNLCRENITQLQNLAKKVEHARKDKMDS